MMGALENAGPYVEFSIEGADYYPWQYNIYEPSIGCSEWKSTDSGRSWMGSRDKSGISGKNQVSD